MKVDDGSGPEEQEPGRGYAIAYAYLDRRERTVAEMRARLEQAALPAGEVEAVLAELLEFGYLNDSRYARVYAEDRRALDGWGGERIARALRERGVGRDHIAAALAGESRDDELERAVALLARRFPERPREPREWQRALGVLTRKGFGSELAVEALARRRRSDAA